MVMLYFGGFFTKQFLTPWDVALIFMIIYAVGCFFSWCWKLLKKGRR